MSAATTKYIETVNLNHAKRNSILTSLERALTGGQDLITNSQWNPLRNFAKTTLLSILKNITKGELTIESLGEEYKLGAPFDFCVDGHSFPISAKVTVKDESLWVRMLLHADYGFADALMLGEVDCDKMTDVFKIFVLNRKAIGEGGTFLTPLFSAVSYVSNLRFSNALGATKSNISAHYDLSNEVFSGFLSWDMTYSGAIFDEKAKGAIGDLVEKRPVADPRIPYTDRTMPPDDLERGQLAKLHLVAQRAKIKQGSHVLEIGCGWGSFSILAAGFYGATVEALTLSVEQKLATEKHIADANLSHAINVHVLDYREMPESFHHAFDAVVSIDVMEHIGIEYMSVWFQKMVWAMKPESAFKVFTVTTVPDTRWHLYTTEVDFIRKYIYPGGCLSSVKTLVNAMVPAGLNVESIENIGPHYARTCREWRHRFDRNFDSHIRPALLKKYPNLSEQDTLIFQRKWRYYFAYAEAGFALRSISNHIFTCTLEGNLKVTSTCEDRSAPHFVKV